jgi:transaldolase / glucose-6-phosphate isomerase
MEIRNPGDEAENPLLKLRRYGQSVWLDFMRRSLITSGELTRRVAEDGLAGVTSNPAIFQKAIEGNQDYVEQIAELAKDTRLSPRQVFEKLAVRDIQDAADVLLPVYRQTGGVDGYVSLEVAPDVANDTQASVEEGRRLWQEVSRPNLMIKVPGTREGLPAILTLLQEGINVNVTLLFSRSIYERVAETFIEALEVRAGRGDAVSGVASVASFFVSRIDTLVESQIEDRRPLLGEAERPRLDALAGKVAIANAKLAYQSYKRIFSGPRWDALAARGARPQRVLWASTGTKNPKYSDVLYVQELIGPDTVNTMPPETLSAFRDHGQLRSSLEEDVDGARRVLDELEQLGISLDGVTDALLIDGVKKFVEPYTKLLETVERRVRELTAKK